VVEVTFVVLENLVVTVLAVATVVAVEVVVTSGPGSEVVVTGFGTSVVLRRLRASERLALVPQAPANIVTAAKERMITRRLSILPSWQNSAAIGARGDVFGLRRC